MKILTFGDLHIGKKSSNSFFLDLDKKVVDLVCQGVIKNNIQKVVFLGDLIHNRSESTPKAMEVARYFLDKLNSLNIPIIMILGNHDTYYNNKKDANYYRIFEGLFPNIIFVEDFLETGTALYVGWIQTPEEEAKYKELSKKYKWIFGHLEFKGTEMNEYYRTTSGMENENLNSFIISGHIHQRTQMNKLYYVGSPYPQTWHGKNRQDYGYAIIDTEKETIDFTDLGLHYFNEHKLQRFMMLVKVDKDKIKKELLNSETKIKIDVPLDERQLADVKLFLNSFKPKNLLVEKDSTSLQSSNISYDKIVLADPIEFISDYITGMKMADEQKGRILERVRNILSA